MPHAKSRPMQLDLEHKLEHCLLEKPFLKTHQYVVLVFQDFPDMYILSIKRSNVVLGPYEIKTYISLYTNIKLTYQFLICNTQTFISIIRPSIGLKGL